jgi:hypothetical protein
LRFKGFASGSGSLSGKGLAFTPTDAPSSLPLRPGRAEREKEREKEREEEEDGREPSPIGTFFRLFSFFQTFEVLLYILLGSVSHAFAP